MQPIVPMPIDPPTKEEPITDKKSTVVQPPPNTETENSDQKPSKEKMEPMVIDDHKVKEPTAQQPLVTENTWICAACTFENRSSVTKCEVCDTPRSVGNVAREDVEMVIGDDQQLAMIQVNDVSYC
jgi:hypothetical protein